MAVSVRVLCEIEIIESGNFGPKWTLEDIRKAGLREAMDTMRRLLAKNPGKIILKGEPKAISFVHTEDLK